MKRLYTIEDIRRLVKEERQTELILAPGDLITPAALDEAAALGLKIERPAGPKPGTIPTESEVRRVVQAILDRAGAGEPVNVDEVIRAVVAWFRSPSTQTAPHHRTLSLVDSSDIVTEVELRQRLMSQRNITAVFKPGTRFTPAARDLLKAWGIKVKFE